MHASIFGCEVAADTGGGKPQELNGVRFNGCTYKGRDLTGLDWSNEEMEPADVGPLVE